MGKTIFDHGYGFTIKTPIISELRVNIPIPEVQKFVGKNEVTQMESGGITCRQCNGTGFIGEKNNEPCSMCGGSGEITAKITVEWIPNIPVKK